MECSSAMEHWYRTERFGNIRPVRRDIKYSETIAMDKFHRLRLSQDAD